MTSIFCNPPYPSHPITQQSQRAQEIYEQIEKEYDLPIQDKSMKSMLMFSFNFDELTRVLDFLVQNQKK